MPRTFTFSLSATLKVWTIRSGIGKFNILSRISISQRLFEHCILPFPLLGCKMCQLTYIDVNFHYATISGQLIGIQGTWKKDVKEMSTGMWWDVMWYWKGWRGHSLILWYSIPLFSLIPLPSYPPFQSCLSIQFTIHFSLSPLPFVCFAVHFFPLVFIHPFPALFPPHSLLYTAIKW